MTTDTLGVNPGRRIMEELYPELAWPCPPEHRARLKLAGVGSCPSCGGCPLCETRGSGPGTSCWRCTERAVAVVERESPPADPWCMVHGIPTEDSRRRCVLCDQVTASAKLAGWSSRTGHDGADCCHCDVCGLCKGSGRVCRHCWRCDAHPLTADDWDAPECQQWRWDRFTRAERAYYVHSCWHPDTGRWAS